MRIDLPCCDFGNCRYYSDCNCIDKNKYNKCYYRQLKNNIDEEKEVSIESTFNANEYEFSEYMTCPSCESEADVGNFLDSELYFKYCPNCGQKLKFTEALYE